VLADEPEQARTSLGRAMAMNPFVKAGPEAVLAGVEIGP